MMDEGGLPAQPSTPMTGPQRRRLDSMPQQGGNGESETDFAAYVVPSTPAELAQESDPANRFLPLLTRRRLPTQGGYRRL